MVFSLDLAIEAVPAACGVVTANVTVAVSVVIATINIVVGVAFQSGSVAVSSVEIALFGVASLIAESILENIPAKLSSGCGIAKLPRVDSEPAIASVIAAGVSVALFVASVISGLPLALELEALLLFQVNVHDFVSVVGLINTAGTGLILNVTILALPLSLARTVVIADSVNALPIFARVVSALIASILLARSAGGSSGTDAFVFGSIAGIDASAAIAAGIAIARCSSKFAVGPDETRGT